MKDLLKNLADLIKVKTLVTLIVVSVWAYLALTQKNLADVKDIVMMVVAFYFGTQVERKS